MSANADSLGHQQVADREGRHKAELVVSGGGIGDLASVVADLAQGDPPTEAIPNRTRSPTGGDPRPYAILWANPVVLAGCHRLVDEVGSVAAGSATLPCLLAADLLLRSVYIVPLDGRCLRPCLLRWMDALRHTIMARPSAGTKFLSVVIATWLLLW